MLWFFARTLFASCLPLCGNCQFPGTRGRGAIVTLRGCIGFAITGGYQDWCHTQFRKLLLYSFELRPPAPLRQPFRNIDWGIGVSAAAGVGVGPVGARRGRSAIFAFPTTACFFRILMLSIPLE